MRPADRLDALLLLPTPAGVRLQGPADDGLAPLLAAAGRLAPLRRTEPSPAFAGALEARLLARAAALAAPSSHVAPLPSSAAGPSSSVPPTLARGRAGTPRHLPRVFWPAVAAALVLVVGAGTLTAAAAAGPGSPLYALHRWEQSVQAQLATSAAERVRLHLANARSALAALESAVAGHAGGSAYSDALVTLQAEDQAAASALASVPAGPERDALAAQIDTLHADERQALRAALPGLGWSDRLATTQNLGRLGEAVPRVTNVQAQPAADGHGHAWLVTITGSGFQPGAMLVVNGKPVGEVVSVTPSSVTVALDDSGLQRLAHAAGVENPDGTTAALAQLSISSQAAATATPADHGGTGGKGGGHGHEPTPTPHGR